MRKVTKNIDGTINVKVTDTRTTQEKLVDGLTFAEKLDILYPTPEADIITKGWEVYDEHKFNK